MYAALPYNFLEYTRMNWNPYKRIAALEQEVIDLREQARHLNVRLDLLRSMIVTAPVIASADAAEQKRIKQREYQRAYVARKKAKEKACKYQQAYRDRKNAVAAAVELAVGGTE